MTHNSNWFESPFPKAATYFHPPNPRRETQHEHDDSQWIRPIQISPQALPPIFRSAHTPHPLSPWSKLINPEPENKESEIEIPGFILDNEVIDKELIYSDNENYDQEPITPVRKEEKCKEEGEEGELLTTGKKSQLQPTVKKSRPRQKGLRRLSQRAFEIVQEMRNATYKEVAAKLVQELNEEQFEGQNKEQQNIKRRVYDALNVLIALGVLKKDGRRIVSQRGSKKGKKTEPEESETLKMKLLAKSNIVEEKRRKLKETQEKFNSITTLLQRNKESKFSKDAIIPFPFIGIFLNPADLQKVRHQRADEFLVKSSEPMQPFGDIDSLKWLKYSLERFSLQDRVLAPCGIRQQQQDQSS